MSSICRAVLVGCVVASNVASPLVAASDADIRQAQEQFRQALISGDAATLGALFADDLVYVHSDGRVQNKAQFLEPIQTGRLRFSSVSACDTPRIHAHEESAIVSACYELKVGTSVSRHLFLIAYAKLAGSWRIAAIQTTRAPDSPSP